MINNKRTTTKERVPDIMPFNWSEFDIESFLKEAEKVGEILLKTHNLDDDEWRPTHR